MTHHESLRRIAEAAQQDSPDNTIMNAADADFFEAFSPVECLRLLDELAMVEELGRGAIALGAERTKERDELLEAAEGVLAAFDAGAFVRDIRGDGDPAWGMKLFPHLRWLAKLTQLVRPEPSPRPPEER